ncbi:MAG: M23 family metallopeptidase [Christensenellaceae bacterium]|jgi:murein DD-endopeptidase MepM/ murein hydrolase activator NlpD|nr:M23 family metallopeptidase [Christensenellaceae bacterium]
MKDAKKGRDEVLLRFSAFWEKRGFTLVLCLCFGLIGFTALFTRMPRSQAEGELPQMTAYQPPSPSPLPAAAVIEPEEETPELALPVDGGKQGIGYSADALVFQRTTADYRTHPGVDYPGPEGTPVRAMMGGRVERTYEDPFLGVCVLIDHLNGYTSLYASLSEELLVKEGDYVSAAQAIGLVGSNLSERAEGLHTHVELRKNGLPVDPN